MQTAGSFAFDWLTVQKWLLHAIAMCVSLLLLAGCLFESHINGITLHIGADLPHGAIFWDEIGPFWGCAILGLFRAILGLPWAMFCNFGAIEGHLGVCPCLLGPFLGQPGVCLGHLGAILGFPGAILEPSWGIFGPSSGHLEAKLGCERTREKRKAKGRTEIGQFRKNCTAPRREHRFPCFGAPC